MPQDFFIDIVSRNNFLVDNLHVSSVLKIWDFEKGRGGRGWWGRGRLKEGVMGRSFCRSVIFA